MSNNRWYVEHYWLLYKRLRGVGGKFGKFKFIISSRLRDGLIAYYCRACIPLDSGINYYILNYEMDPYAPSI